MEKKTKRTAIRQLTYHDYPAIFEIYKDEETAKLAGVHKMHTYIDAERMVVRLLSDFHAHIYIVNQIEDNIIIGTLSAVFVYGGQGVEIGYAIHPAYRRHGYAEESIKELMNYYLHNYRFLYFQAVIKNQNYPSRYLAEKLGFSLVDENINGNRDCLYRKYNT